MSTVKEVFDSLKSHDQLNTYSFYIKICTEDGTCIYSNRLGRKNDIPSEFGTLPVIDVHNHYIHALMRVYSTVYVDTDIKPSAGNVPKYTGVDASTIEGLISKVSLIVPKVIICEKGSGRVYSGPIISIPRHLLETKYITATIDPSLQEMLITVEGDHK